MFCFKGEVYILPLLGIQEDVTVTLGVSNPDDSSTVSVTATYYQVELQRLTFGHNFVM